MAIQKIDFYGQFRPAGVDTGESRVFQQAANLSATIQDKLTKSMFERAQSEGTQEGLSVQTRDEQGELQAPNLRNDYTIKGQAFDAAAKVAYISEVRRDARENVNRIYNESEDVVSFDNRAESYLKASTSELPEDMRFEVENDLKNTIHAARLKKETEFYNKEMNRNLEIVNSEIEATADDLLTAYNTGDREQGARLRVGLEEVLARAEQAGLVNATQRGQILNQLDEEAEKEIYLGDMQRIIDSAQPLGERLKLAENAINEAKKTDFKHLNPRQKESLIASMSGKASGLMAELEKAKTKQKLEQSRDVSNLKVLVNTDQGEIGSLIDQTEGFFDAGMITESERTGILTKLVERQQKELDKEKRFQMFADRLSGDDTILVDQKLTDEVYDEAIAPQLEELDPLEANTVKASLIQSTNKIPTRVKKEISNAIESRNVDQIRVVSDLVDRIETIPGANLGLTANDEAFVNKVVTLSQTLPIEEAVDVATRATDPKDIDRIEARRKLIKKEKIPETYEEAVLDEIDGLNDISKDKAVKEYKELFESYFEAGMDKESASEKAITRLSANWMESEAAGMTIKNPPEQFYTVAGDSSYIREQLLKDVFTENIFGGDESHIEVFLQSDDRTAREASKGSPSYIVMIVSEQDGIYALPERWTPDVAAQAEKVKKSNLTKYQELRKDATNPNRTLESLAEIGQGF